MIKRTLVGWRMYCVWGYCGYICPKKERSVRDLLRKRSQLVRQKTENVLSIINLFTRNTGKAINLRQLKKLTAEELRNQFRDESLCLAVASNLEVFCCLEAQVKLLEQAILEQVKLRKEFIQLKTVNGIGDHAGGWRDKTFSQSPKLRILLSLCW